MDTDFSFCLKAVLFTRGAVPENQQENYFCLFYTRAKSSKRMNSFNPIAKQVEMEYVFIILLFITLRQCSSCTFFKKNNALAKCAT